MNQFPAIRGFQEISLIDWDGKIASIIFLGECNFKCPFCHSRTLVLNPEKLESIPFEKIEAFLRKKRGWVDGVVITGGEPTLEGEALFNLIILIKALGFLVKLDTNGTNPDCLKTLMDADAIDYIAMDIKAPFAAKAYSKATGTEINIKDIILSKHMILNSDIDYEFRTTLAPGIVSASDIEEIAKSIASCKKYCLQQFVPRDTIDKSFLKVKPYSDDELKKIKKAALAHISNVIVRK